MDKGDLYQANKLIQFNVERGTFTNSEKLYYNEYIRPKDPLFEKFKDWYGSSSNRDWIEQYSEFKKHFKDELNQTAGLNDAIREFVERPWHISYNTAYIISVLEEVKSNLENK